MYSLNIILKQIKCDYELLNANESIIVNSATAILEADEKAITWLDVDNPKYLDYLLKTKAAVIVLKCLTPEVIEEFSRIIFIAVSKSRLTFMRLVRDLFVKPSSFGIHHNDVIGENVKISEGVVIGL